MTDYEAMCGNKIMVRMMSKVIGCEENAPSVPYEIKASENREVLNTIIPESANQPYDLIRIAQVDAQFRMSY